MYTMLSINSGDKEARVCTMRYLLFCIYFLAAKSDIKILTAI